MVIESGATWRCELVTPGTRNEHSTTVLPSRLKYSNNVRTNTVLQVTQSWSVTVKVNVKVTVSYM